MNKTIKKDNVLIKKTVLLKELHKKEIRANKKALEHLSSLLQENVVMIIDILAKEITVKGKKTLTIKDIDSVFEKLKEKEDSWEI